MTTIQEFKLLFLKLTQYTIPHGYESALESFLPSGFQQDSFGNYFYEIGNSETLFTTHLDTYCVEPEKVNHVIDGNKISTDGTTILGGDNKLGTTILINMINERKPGTYYFFAGEEPTAEGGGLYGSKNALKSNPEFFKKFKRCIAFDRKEYGSIVTRQMARNCCSLEFATKLAEGLQNSVGIEWNKSVGYGYYTDTAVFMDVIPEVTNLSAGGFREHHKDEWVDLDYTYKVLKFALRMDWESLPVVRQLESFEQQTGMLKKFKHFKQQDLFNRVKGIMGFIDLLPTKDRITEKGREITFSRWLQDLDVDVILNSNNIIIDNVRMNYERFLSYIIKNYIDDIEENYEYYFDQEDGKTLNNIIKLFNCRTEDQFFKKIGL